MRVALLHTTNPGRRIALNKDLNGGLGTADDYGPTWRGRLLSWLKWKLINLPVISTPHIQAILKARGHEAAYYEDAVPDRPFDVGLMYGSLVDFRNENEVVARLKKAFPSARIGFYGAFPARYPERFPAGDFVLGGEAEAFFLREDPARLTRESGLISNPHPLDLDELPTPDYAGFPISRYRYTPMLPKRPYLPLLASKGCPYSCGYYCAYGEFQGAKYQQRSAEKVYEDMRLMRERHGVRSIQFRDATWGIDRRFVDELCRLLRERPLGIEWGIETRSDLLSPELVDELAASGLRSMNLGVETLDDRVAGLHKRKLDEQAHQEAVLARARRLGVRVNLFFMLGLEDDTLDGLDRIARYALALDPEAARFCVSTPYPGTPFYAQVEKEGRLLETDWEKFTQFSLVHRHPRLTAEQVREVMLDAYTRFYFRPGYLLKRLLALA